MNGIQGLKITTTSQVRMVFLLKKSQKKDIKSIRYFQYGFLENK